MGAGGRVCMRERERLAWGSEVGKAAHFKSRRGTLPTTLRGPGTKEGEGIERL